MNAMILLAIASAAAAQDQLTLKAAVAAALRSNPALAASQANRDVTTAEIAAARSGARPKVNYSESWTRSDNPVFVFSSLLTQRQFTQDNFALPALNEPDFLDNFRSQLSADQPLYDAGRTKRAVKIAELAQANAGESLRGTQTSVIAQVAKAYFAVQLAGAQLQVTAQAKKSAEADLDRAENRRSAGMATDADVLSIRVHLAKVREDQIQRSADLDVARAALNGSMGLPLDQPHELTTPLTQLSLPPLNLEAVESGGVADRSELRQARLAQDIANAKVTDARGNYLPQVTAHAEFEADRQRFVVRGGANWLVSIGLHWNLLNGGADKARIEAGAAAVRQASAERARAEVSVRLQIRQAWAGLQAAQQRMETARAAVAEAQESLRISQNRYDAGLVTVTDLLRTETALLETRTSELAAVHDERVAAVLLQFAAGLLNADSEVLN